MKIRSQVHFAMLPEWILLGAISDKAVRLYGILNRYAQGKGRCHPSRSTLREDLRVKNVRTVDRCIAELESIGAIRITKRFTQRGDQTSNEYLLHVVPEGATQMSLGGDSDVATPGDSDVAQKESHIEREKPKDLKPTSLFDAFWKIYPARNGKKLDKGKAQLVWSKLSDADQDAAITGATHYADACGSGMTIAKDAFRWLRDGCWADWQTPAEPLSNGRPRDRFLDAAALALSAGRRNDDVRRSSAADWRPRGELPAGPRDRDDPR